MRNWKHLNDNFIWKKLIFEHNAVQICNSQTELTNTFKCRYTLKNQQFVSQHYRDEFFLLDSGGSAFLSKKKKNKYQTGSNCKKRLYSW